MKEKFLNLPFKTITIHLFIVVALLGVTTFLTLAFYFLPVLAIIYAIISFSFCFIYLIFISLAISDFLKRQHSSFKEQKIKGKWHTAKTAFKNRKMIKRMTTAIISGMMNFIIGVFYIVLSLVTSRYFYAFISLIYLLAFSTRIYLISLGFDNDKNKAIRGLFYTSLLILFYGFGLLGVVLYVYFGDGNFLKNHIVIGFIVLFTTIKLLIAIFNLLRLKRKNNLLPLCYAELSLALALFSLFTMQVELLNAFGQEGSNQRFAFIGIIIVVIILCVAILFIIKAIKEKKIYQKQIDDAENVN